MKTSIILTLSLFTLLSGLPCLADFRYDLEYAHYPTAGADFYDGVPAAKITAKLKFGDLPCEKDYPC